MGPMMRTLAVVTVFFSTIRASRVDTHFHALPAPYINALNANGGDISGFPTPDWSIEAAINAMDAIGTTLGIMSVSSPGVPVAGTGATARALARTLNNQLGNYSTNCKYGNKLGFFGVLPDFQDVNGALAEIDYLYSQQKLCAGVTIYTSYGGKLLGNPQFAPIWSKLQQYKALVFLHPSVLDVSPFFIGPSIPQPIIDYPLATTRAAVDLVTTGTFRACPDVDIILSHAGGAIPFIAPRAISALALPEISSHAKVSAAEAQSDFARYYYDIALSTSAAQLDGLLDFATPDHIVFGSDFPYAPQIGIDVIIAQYASFVSTNTRGAKLASDVLTANSLKLLNSHSKWRQYK